MNNILENEYELLKESIDSIVKENQFLKEEMQQSTQKETKVHEKLCNSKVKIQAEILQWEKREEKLRKEIKETKAKAFIDKEGYAKEIREMREKLKKSMQD